MSDEAGARNMGPRTHPNRPPRAAHGLRLPGLLVLDAVRAGAPLLSSARRGGRGAANQARAANLTSHLFARLRTQARNILRTTPRILR